MPTWYPPVLSLGLFRIYTPRFLGVYRTQGMWAVTEVSSRLTRPTPPGFHSLCRGGTSRQACWLSWEGQQGLREEEEQFSQEAQNLNFGIHTGTGLFPL